MRFLERKSPGSSILNSQAKSDIVFLLVESTNHIPKAIAVDFGPIQGVVPNQFGYTLVGVAVNDPLGLGR